MSAMLDAEEVNGRPQIRTIELHLRELSEEDPEGTVEFYAATFGTKHRGYGTYFEKGCWKRSLREGKGKFPVCWMHRFEEPVALGLHSEDDTGLLVRGVLDLDTELGRRVCSGVRKGYVDCASVTFGVQKWEKDDEGDYHYTQCTLWESSLLTRGFSADPTALVQDVRTLPGLAAHIAASTRAVEAGNIREAIEGLRAAIAQLETRAGETAEDHPPASDPQGVDVMAAVTGELRDLSAALDALRGPSDGAPASDRAHSAAAEPASLAALLEDLRGLGRDIETL